MREFQDLFTDDFNLTGDPGGIVDVDINMKHNLGGATSPTHLQVISVPSIHVFQFLIC
jgi:hypothetical protein